MIGASPKRFKSWPKSLGMFAIASIGEFIALAGWYVLHHANRPIWSGFYDPGDCLVRWLRHVEPGSWIAGVGENLLSPHPVYAVVVLWIGFIVERAVVVLWLDIPKLVVTPGGQLRSRTLVLFGVTLAEIVVWLVWVWLVEQDEPWFAAAFLFVGIHAVHSYEVALIKHAQVKQAFVNRDVFVITFLESAGAVWALSLAARGRILMPLLIMLGALVLEHIFQVAGLKRDEEAGV